MAACRFCCTCVGGNHRYNLFNCSADLPGRFRKLLQLPVTKCDGLSSFYCRQCLLSVEKTPAEILLSPVIVRLDMVNLILVVVVVV